MRSLLHALFWELKAILALLPLILLALAIASWMQGAHPRGQAFLSSPVSPPPTAAPEQPMGAPQAPAVTPDRRIPLSPPGTLVPTPTPLPVPETVSLNLLGNPLFVALIILVLAAGASIAVWLWVRS